MTPLFRLAILLVAILSLDLILAANVLPIKPHRIDQSIIVRRELAKRGLLHKLDKSKQRRDARSSGSITEGYHPEYAGTAPLPGIERGPIPPLHRRTPHRRVVAPHRHRHRRQGEYLISGLDISNDTISSASASASSSVDLPSAAGPIQLLDPVLSSSAPASSLSNTGDPSTTSATSSFVHAVQLLDVSASHSIDPSATSSGPPVPSAHYIDSIPLDPRSGIAYTIEVGLGIEGQLAPLLIDTGSTVFWAAAKTCATCRNARMVLAVDAPADAPDAASLNYGTGRVISSKQVTTELDLGEIILQNYGIYAATEIDVTLQRFGAFMSGIFGIGLSPGNTPDSPIDVLYEGGTIASPLIGFYLAREHSDDNSQVVIGDPFNLEDTDLHIDFGKKANLTQAKAGDAHYNVKMDDFKIHGMSLSGMQNLIVTPDSGSTNFFLPEEYLNGIFATIGNGSYWKYDYSGSGHPDFVVPCGLYPPESKILSLVFAGVEFGIQWQDIRGKNWDTNYPDWCVPRILESPAQSLFIIGDAFLINVFHTVNTQTGEVTFYGYKSAA